MLGLAKKYKIEIATFLVCGAICTFLLWPVISAQLAYVRYALGNSTPVPEGEVLVRQAGTGVPLFGGDDVRGAVETRVAAIRVALGQPVDREQPVPSWDDAGRLRDTLPAETRKLCRSTAGADYRNVDLHGLDLRGINLSFSDFRGADLSGALLEGAFLKNAHFDGADLSDIDFRALPQGFLSLQQPIEGASFRRSNFEGTIVNGGVVKGDFREANLRNATITAWGTTCMDIRGADLRGAALIVHPLLPAGKGGQLDEILATFDYDDTTRVDGMRLGSMTDTTLPFVQWAIEHGALASFPRQEGTEAQWALREWKSCAVICRGDSPANALAGHRAKIREAIARATGLDYPEHAAWPDVEMAIQALPATGREDLRTLIQSTACIDLQGLDLSGADLRGLRLDGALIRDTVLSGADLSDATLAGARIADSDFSGARIENGDLSRVQITSTSFAGATLDGCAAVSVDCSQSDFSGVRMACTDLSGAHFRDVRLNGSRLRDVTMAGVTLQSIQFDGAILDTVDWTDADCDWISFDRAFLRMNDFSGAVIGIRGFAGIILGDDCRWDGALLSGDRYGNVPDFELLGAIERGGGSVLLDSEAFYSIRNKRHSERDTERAANLAGALVSSEIPQDGRARRKSSPASP